MLGIIVPILILGTLIVIACSVKNRAVKYLSIALLLALLFMGIGMPFFVRLTGPPALGTGSHEHARLWRDKLAACNSLDDVRSQFNCGSYRVNPGGSRTHVRDPDTIRKGNTWALLYDLPDGDWLAIAYASSHNTWGGGTVVTRDNTGNIRVFFGHVCGRPSARGKSLEELYAWFRGPEWKEVLFTQRCETPAGGAGRCLQVLRLETPPGPGASLPRT